MSYDKEALIYGLCGASLVTSCTCIAYITYTNYKMYNMLNDMLNESDNEFYDNYITRSISLPNIKLTCDNLDQFYDSDLESLESIDGNSPIYNALGLVNSESIDFIDIDENEDEQSHGKSWWIV